MDYYVIKQSVDLKIIGKYPQLEKMFDGFHMLRRYEAFGLHSEIRKVPMKRLWGFKLKHHAKITDWVSAAQFGVDTALISDRFFDLLQEYRCMPFICIDSEVAHQKNTYSYKFVHFPEKQNYVIDFWLSRFCLIDMEGNLEPINIENEEHFENIKREVSDLNDVLKKQDMYSKMRNIRVINLALNEKKVAFDFFRITQAALGFIVSAPLKKAMEDRKLCGIKFIPLSDMSEFY